MLASHATTEPILRQMFHSVQEVSGREYFETSPLFSDLRETRMLEAMVIKSEHDLMMDDPSLDVIVSEIYRALGIK